MKAYVTLAVVLVAAVSALTPGAVFADEREVQATGPMVHPYFGAVDSFQDYGWVCCGEQPATGGGAVYISPTPEPAQAAPGQTVHPYFGAVDSFVDYGRLSPNGATGGGAGSAPSSGGWEYPNGVVRSEVFYPSGG